MMLPSPTLEPHCIPCCAILEIATYCAWIFWIPDFETGWKGVKNEVPKLGFPVAESLKLGISGSCQFDTGPMVCSLVFGEYPMVIKLGLLENPPDLHWVGGFPSYHNLPGLIPQETPLLRSHVRHSFFTGRTSNNFGGWSPNLTHNPCSWWYVPFVSHYYAKFYPHVWEVNPKWSLCNIPGTQEIEKCQLPHVTTILKKCHCSFTVSNFRGYCNDALVKHGHGKFHMCKWLSQLETFFWKGFPSLPALMAAGISNSSTLTSQWVAIPERSHNHQKPQLLSHYQQYRTRRWPKFQ